MGASPGFAAAREQFPEESRLRPKASTYKECLWLLHKHFPFTKALAKVNRQDIMEVVTQLQDKPSAARHAYLAIRIMMNWAVRRHYLTISPVPPLTFTSKSHSRILSDEELKAALEAGSRV